MLFGLDPRQQGQPAVMAARLAVADLAGILAERAGLGTPADCLVWINGCEAIDAGAAGRPARARAGHRDGRSAQHDRRQHGRRLAGQVNVVTIRGRAPQGLAGQAAALAGPAGSSPGVGCSPGRWLAGRAGWPAAAVPVPGPASPPGSPAAVSLNPQDSPGLPADLPAEQPADALSLRVRSPRPRLVTGCRAVR